MKDKQLFLIKELEMNLIAGVELTSDDIDFLFSSLSESFGEDVQLAALLLLVESDDSVLDLVIQNYSSFSTSVKHLTLSYLTTTDYVNCFLFLFELIEQSPSDEEVNIAVVSLAYTDYYIFPFILVGLGSDNDGYVTQLKRLLLLMGIDKLKPYLSVLPYIPHEAIFRDLFGEDVIDSIKH